jgi:hypothetical protein
MTDNLLPNRQRARLLEHELWVAQRPDGNWLLWIEGKKPLGLKTVFPSQEGAKRIVHSLAHRHLEGKAFCDCTIELQWEQIHTTGAEASASQEKRSTRRINFSCEIQWQDQAVFSIGRIRNLSAGGAFVQTLNPASVGSVLKLKFVLGSVQVDTLGKVLHLIPSQGMGIQFLDLDAASREAIENLLLQTN